MERVVVHPTPDLTARAAGMRLLLTLVEAQSVHSPVHVALTGGTMGIQMLAAVAGDELLDAVDWTGVHLWWGDERFASDGDRNASQARKALIDELPIPSENVHEVARPSEVDDVDAAAAAYAEDVRGVRFDVVVLGVGPDGHVASLFPGRREVEVDGPGALAVRNSPKLPPERVSLTREQLCAADEVWFVAAGADKSGAIRDAIRPGDVPLPAARVRGERATIWILDTAAASSL